MIRLKYYICLRHNNNKIKNFFQYEKYDRVKIEQDAINQTSIKANKKNEFLLEVSKSVELQQNDLIRNQRNRSINMAENKIPDEETLEEKKEEIIIEDTVVDEKSAATKEDLKEDQIETEKKNKDENEGKDKDKNKTDNKNKVEESKIDDKVKDTKTDDKYIVEKNKEKVGEDTTDEKNETNDTNEMETKEVESDLLEKPLSYSIPSDVKGIL